jgi:hypothetical protein
MRCFIDAHIAVAFSDSLSPLHVVFKLCFSSSFCCFCTLLSHLMIVVIGSTVL